MAVPDLALAADRPAAGETAGGCVDPGVMAALLRLPRRQPQAVALRLVLDLDTERTARGLGIAPGTVQAHLGRVCRTQPRGSPTTRRRSDATARRWILAVHRALRARLPGPSSSRETRGPAEEPRCRYVSAATAARRRS